MTTKRKYTFPPSDDISFSKRSRPSFSTADEGENTNSTLGTQPRVDPTYGQRGAFPGLDDGNRWKAEDAIFYGPASDGLEYLQMVRSEARGVPNLLVAPNSPPATTTGTNASSSADLDHDHLSPARGYYADGAYVAVPDSNFTRSSRTGIGGGKEEVNLDLDPDPQEAYYTSLLHRFTALTTLLHSPPPPPSAPPPTSIPSDLYSIRKWRWILLHRQPTMIILSQFSQQGVIHALAALETVLERRGWKKRGGDRLGAWAWGLLARCRVVGEMGSEEVGVLRGLGKKAWWILREVSAGVDEEEEEVVEEEEEEEEEEDGEEDGEGKEDGEVEEDEEEGDDEDDEEKEEGEVDEDEEDEQLQSEAEAPDDINNDAKDHSPNVQKTRRNPLPSPNNATPTPLKNTSITTTINNPIITPPSEPPSLSTTTTTADGPLSDLAAAQQRLLATISPFSPASSSSSSSFVKSVSHFDAYREGMEGMEGGGGLEGVEGPKDEEANDEERNRISMVVMLDMILTVVGERYGQKDLLVGRGFWGE